MLGRLCRQLGQPEVTEAFLDRPEIVTLIAQDQGEAVGWLYGYELARPEGTGSYLLYSIDVLEAHRRKGHGRRLLEAFLGSAREAGAVKVWLLTDVENDAANALYEGVGGEIGEPPARLFSWTLANDVPDER